MFKRNAMGIYGLNIYNDKCKICRLRQKGQKIAEINSNFIAGNHNIRILNFCIISYKFVHFCETDWYKLIWMGKKKKIV